MATKFLSLSIAPKENKKKTVFTHWLNDNLGWSESKCTPNEFDNVLHLGVFNAETKESLFKTWDGNNSYYTIYRGILGEEEYTSL